MSTYPHVPAAFINALSEEGTKKECIAFLQEQWNENRWLWEKVNHLEDIILHKKGYENV